MALKVFPVSGCLPSTPVASEVTPGGDWWHESSVEGMKSSGGGFCIFWQILQFSAKGGGFPICCDWSSLVEDPTFDSSWTLPQRKPSRRWRSYFGLRKTSSLEKKVKRVIFQLKFFTISDHFFMILISFLSLYLFNLLFLSVGVKEFLVWIGFVVFPSSYCYVDTPIGVLGFLLFFFCIICRFRLWWIGFRKIEIDFEVVDWWLAVANT